MLACGTCVCTACGDLGARMVAGRRPRGQPCVSAHQPQQLLQRLTLRKLLSLCSARRVGVGSRMDPAMRFCNEKGAGGPPSPVLDV